jgi:hypothetical protein
LHRVGQQELDQAALDRAAATITEALAGSASGAADPMKLEPAHGLAQLEQAAADVADLLAEAELDRPVPSCPDWTVADLVTHLGQTHLWAEHCIRVGNAEVPDVAAPVTDRAALADWYSYCADALIQTLRATDPGIECWTFGPSPRTAAFWFRRQAHEASMHRWDLLPGASFGFEGVICSQMCSQPISTTAPPPGSPPLPSPQSSG